MKPDRSQSRRYLAVWFPFLPTDRWKRETVGEKRPDAPLILVAKAGGALKVSAVDAEAVAMGLCVGMTVADARARIPDLKAEVHTPEDDDRLLARVLEDSGRFTPMAALDQPSGLILDVTGCAHLFGGEQAMFGAVRRRLEAIDLTTRLALADTPQASRALCRFGPGGMFASGETARAIRALPVAALEAPDADTQALRRAGLKTIGDVATRARSALAARFGSDFSARLDRILGEEDIRITPHRPPAPISADRVLLEPITEDDQVKMVLRDLLNEIADALETSSQGGRAFGLLLFRIDGGVRRLAVRTARATRDPAVIARLFKGRLEAKGDALDPGFGFDHLRLEVLRLETLRHQQAAFDRSSSVHALDELIDRLAARLGEAAVISMEPMDTHMPERAVRWRPALGALPETKYAWTLDEPGATPERPLRIFDPPQPIEAIALAPDSPPARFRWRRVDHRVTRAEGPERIEAEWWRRKERVRDYYRIEDEQGRRFWVFRAGRFGEEPPPRWYLHGLFA